MKMVKIMALMACVTPMLAGSAWAGEASGKPTAAKVRVGTYDSRSVAIAFAGSEAFSKWMGELKAENDKAKASGDSKRISEIEAEGVARQKFMHRQGFSTAPVVDILGQIKDLLPAIKEKAGVTDLVSKWDKASLTRFKDAELVDVTLALVDAFNPNDRQRKSAIKIQKQKPIPLEQAENIKD